MRIPPKSKTGLYEGRVTIDGIKFWLYCDFLSLQMIEAGCAHGYEQLFSSGPVMEALLIFPYDSIKAGYRHIILMPGDIERFVKLFREQAMVGSQHS